MSLAAARAQYPHLKDYTDQELLGIVAQSNNIAAGSPQYKKLESDLLGYDRTWGEAAKDTVVGLGQGVAGLARTVGVVGGALLPGVSAFDNRTATYWDEASKGLDQYKSRGLRNQEAGAAIRADVAERNAAAEGDGAVGRFAAGAGAQLGAYVDNPSLAVQGIVTNVPQLLAGGFIGRGVAAGANMLGAGAQAAGRAGMAAGVGSGGALQGADAGAETYQRLRAAGASHEEATALATDAAMKSGAASIALSTLPGATTIERSLIGGATPMRFGLGRAGTVGRVAATEAITEGADEGYGRYAGNQAVQTVDPNTDLMSGVGSAAIQGGVAAGPIGAYAGLRTAAPVARTETGEIDLTGTRTAPSALDIPAYQRRGLDPLNERSSPYPMQPDRTMADLAGEPVPSVMRGEPAQYTDLVAPPAPAALDPFTEADLAAKARARAEAELAAQQARDARRIQAEMGTSAQGQGVMMATPDGTVLPAQSPEQMAETERARQFQEGIPVLTDAVTPAQASTPNRGQLLAGLQAANTELGKNLIKKNGEVSNTRGTAPLRAVIEAADPLAAMRELHKDGVDPRDEMLDLWHQQLTGETILDWKAKQAAPELNSAGFVPEPAEQVAAQLDAVRDGRKDTAVIGEQEAATAQLDGLSTGVATGPDGAKAIVVSKDPARIEQAVARAKEVGLKVAMGEALGVANPTITSQTAAPAAVAAVQQIDDKSGQVIGEELVTPADLPNVKPIAGTTARIVPVGQPVADRQAATKAKTPKPPKYGRRPSVELVQIAEDTKDEREYEEARYELYRRWANDTDDGVAFEYLNDTKNKSALSKEETARFKERHAAELSTKDAKRGQAMGKRFGADDGTSKVLEAAGPSNPDNGTNALTAEEVAGITDGTSAAKWLVDNAADPWHREVAQRIAPYLDSNVNVRFVKEGDTLPSIVADRLDGDAVAVAHLLPDGNYDLYYRTDKAFNETTLLHELIHGATLRALDAPKNAALRKEAGALADAVRASFRDIASRAGANGLPEIAETAEFFGKVITDPDELLAYAFSSPTLRRYMQNMNADGQFVSDGRTASELRRRAERRAPGVPPLTMWQKFTDLLRKLFGIPPVNQLTFERMMADREAEIAGVVESGKDTELYNQLDDLLQRALDAQAAMNAPGVERVAASQGEPALLKPFSQAAKEVAASVTAATSGKEISPALLSVMTLRQIDEQFGKKLPALRDWIGAIMQRSSNASKLAAEADRVALQWEQSVKDPVERKALADILLRASVAELSLDDTSGEYLASLSPAERAEHSALRAKLAGLSEDARRTRKQALEILSRQWDYTRQSLESFIQHTVPDPALRNQRIEDLKREMGRNRGDYFPLSRFGDRIVIGRGAASDGRDVVSFHETAASADAEVKRLKAEGVKRVDVTLQTERDSRQRASTGFMGSLHAMIDSSEADSGVKDSLHEALQQLYLKSLPELSGAKHMIRREAVEGFSQDALRAFADSVTRGARYASHLEAAPQIQAAQEAAETQSRSSDKRSAAVVVGRKDGEPPVVQVVPTGTDRLNAVNSLAEQGYDTEFFNTVPEAAAERLAGALDGATPEQIAGYVNQVEQVVGRTEEGVEDMRAAKALYNHMVKLQRTEGAEDPSKIVEALGQAGYTWYLGFSPAFWAMNTLQNPMIGIPHLGSKYGVGKAGAEMLGAAKWFAGVRMNKLFTDRTTPFSIEWLKEAVKTGNLKGISKQELDMLQTLEDRQVLDFTQAMDLSRIGQASSDKRYKFMRLAAAGAHHTEVFNRVTFALAAYRLALKSSGDVSHNEAVRRAENDLTSVHFDYSYANKPEMMRGKASRLLFMFQQYRQHMLYWWAKNIKDIVKNESPAERSRALKAALLMGTTNAVFAGAMGLPFVGAVAFLANALGGEDDDGVPFDFNRWITEAAKEVTGSDKAGEVMAKGIFAALGLNISQRIGQADLLPFLNEGAAKYEKNADDKMRAYLFDLAGPLGSIALNLARSSEAFARGDTMGGLAYATPKAAGDVIKAYQLDTEGMKDKRGNYIATAEAFDGADVFLQAAGVAPTRVANIKADRSRVADADNALRDRTRRITGQFVDAWMRGDREGVQEALGDVQEFNRKIATGKLRDKSLLIDGRALEMAIKDRQQRAMLLALTGGTAETKRQLLLATRMSGLFNPVTPAAMQQNAANLPGLPGLPGAN